jgi:hypothetical protein
MDYHKRLVYGKLVDRTLADMDYTELSELVYGQTYSSDVARRMMYGSRRTLELMDMERTSSQDSSILSEMDAKIEELQRERQKFYDQRREYNKLVSREGRREHLYDSLAVAANNLSDSIGTLDFSSPDSAYIEYSDNEAILVFSDWHYGMVTSNIFNSYNTEVCKQRVQDIVQKAKQRIELNTCRKLHILILGDLIHGSIHVGARVASEELVCDQLMQVSEILAQAVCSLHASVQETTVYMTYGNHARTIQNKNDSIHRDNIERIIPWWLKQRLSCYEKITIAEPSESEFLFLNVCGHDMCAAHGDLDSVKSSPRLLSTLFHKRCGRDIEYILLGDKHHIETFNELGVTSMICGSLCGTDEYANNKRLYSDPSQMLLIVNAPCGVDAEYRIRC